MAKRTTLYAAFNERGVPCINVWDFDRKRLETMVSDRVANGEAFPGEHIVQITVAKYSQMLRELGMLHESSRLESMAARKGAA